MQLNSEDIHTTKHITHTTSNSKDMNTRNHIIHAISNSEDWTYIQSNTSPTLQVTTSVAGLHCTNVRHVRQLYLHSDIAMSCILTSYSMKFCLGIMHTVIK